MVERVYTTPGYNTSKVPEHIVGVHLGPPVTIVHQRNQQEKIHHFRPGDILFTPAGSPIHFAHAQAVDALYINIPLSQVEAVSFHLDTATDQPTQLRDDLGTSDTTLHQLGCAYLQELQTPGLGGALYIEALTTQLIIHVLRRFVDRPSQMLVAYTGDTPTSLAARLQPAIDLINDCYAADLSLAQIATAVHLTPYHFSRLFKRAYNVTPHQYLIQQRVQAAQHLLMHTHMTLQEIALEVGFANHSHLTVHFKRLTGQTPRQYGHRG